MRSRSCGRFRLLRRLLHDHRRPFRHRTAPARRRFCARGRRGVVAGQRQSLAVEDRRLAVPLVFGQDGADPRGSSRVVQGTGHQPKLHAEPVGAFLDHDDRAQRGERRVRSRLQQPAPQRAQAGDRIGGAEIDPELGPLDATFGAVSSSASASVAVAQPPSLPGSGSRSPELGGLPGSISLLAEGSGGAMKDCEAISGVAGVSLRRLHLHGIDFRRSALPGRPWPISFANSGLAASDFAGSAFSLRSSAARSCFP